MGLFGSCHGLLFGLIFYAGIQIHSCHPEMENSLDTIRGEAEQVKMAHENIWYDIEALETVLENDLKASEELEPGSEGEASVSDADESVIQRRLDSLDEVVSALEHFVYHESVERKGQLRGLSGKTGESFDGTMEKVKEMTDAMLEEVDITLSGVRKDIKETESSANARNVIVGDLLYYHGIGSACDHWYDSCMVPDSECRDGKCQCYPGLSYDSLRQRCVEECPHGYGNTYQSANSRIIRGYNNREESEVSLDECKRLCETDQNFECRSFDYFPDYETCYLSNSTKLQAEDGWEYNGIGVHFQRDCVYDRY